ncbi:MAG: hypothetical protein KAU95_02845, partial [Candidatus Aenigmarchaeota archaeon]|nr:hypothetical protein [Candidatus Aenigmarchaeota archaeon]
FAVLLVFSPARVVKEAPGYLTVAEEVKICDYYYLCFFVEEEWHRPTYNAGTNLILASNMEIENAWAIKQFFEQDKINLVVNTTEQVSSENSELILRVSPFSHYLGYYYNTIKKEEKLIDTHVLSEYNSTEPAIIILGPSLGAGEDSVKFDGHNIIVQGQTSHSLSLLLGKLLLIAVG